MVASTNSEIMPRAVGYGGSGFGTILHALFGCGITSSCHGRRMQAHMRKVAALAHVFRERGGRVEDMLIL